MRKTLFIIIVGLVLLASCRGRQIKPGSGVELRTIVASMERLDRPNEMTWNSKNVVLTCKNDAGTTVIDAHKYSDENDEDNFHFEPEKLITNATCRLKIKIFEKQANFTNYIWQSIPEEPGLLYISDEAPLQGGKIELKVYKAYQMKTPKKTHISLTDDDCYADLIDGSCIDIRSLEFPFNMGAWWAVVYGRAIDDKDSKQQVIVSMRNGPMAAHQKEALTIQDVIDDLNKPEAQQVFGYFKIGAKEHMETTPMQSGFFAAAQLDKAKMAGFQGFKPLHLGELKAWGYQMVEKTYLDLQKSARWFVSITAEKNSEIVTALIGGAEPDFLSSQRPLGTKFYDEMNPFPAPLDLRKSFKAYRSNASIMVPLSPCGKAIDAYLDQVEWSHATASKISLLPASCSTDPGELAKYYSDWDLTHEYWLESWHNVL